MIPLLPSLRWWSSHLEALRRGEPGVDAAAAACRGCDMSGKDFVRGAIAGPLLLSVPLEGGASVTKRLRPGGDSAGLRLSGHGKWRREHLGAFSAAYGRAPFYIHLMPALEDAYGLSESDPRYDVLAGALYRVTMAWVGEHLRLREACAGNEALRRRMEEMKTKVNTDLSIFDAIFRFGKETALCL